MKNTYKLKESELTNLIKKVIKEQEVENANYMFFSNLKQMKRQIDMMLDMDPDKIDDIIQHGHDWADDHISEAKTNVDQVFDFFKNEMEKYSEYVDYEYVNEGEISEKQKKNTPTNPALWKKSLAWAKSRYKVCPSAYCNGAAAKHYKSLGGKWKKK